MTAENWVKIKAVLQETLSLAPTEREDFLESSGLSEVDKAEVKSLLAFELESEKFMSVSASSLTGELIFEEEERKNSLAGQKIGIYEIRRELGLGGMGAVYLAERADGKFTQRVAIKMLKREFNIERIRRNFRRESEIQSRLNHPNIARLLDSGTTPDGVPYLVMEYVDGVRIDKFCRERNLSLIERLKLFNKICEAVGYAHRNLIIHRDLKPSNILVTAEGEPKLLDFGISKLLDAKNSGDKTAFTFLGAMTPEYASPEQLKGEPVSTATDIYSLGIILYKILTGRRPFDPQGKTNDEILKAVTAESPPPPSGASPFKFQISRSKLNGNGQRETPPPPGMPNPKSLRGDIDNIILKALRKEPELRYPTVEHFSADIWRFIDGLPVSARPATLSYRAGKFVRRHKAAVIAVSLIMLSLIGGLAVAGWQASVAGAQAKIAQEARSAAENETLRAKAEQAKSEKISRFMAKLISYANPSWYAEGAKTGGTARVIDALEELSEKIDTEFADEADVAAELHHKFGEVFSWVAKNEKNVERHAKFKEKHQFHILRALELRQRFYGEWHELVAKDLFYAQGMITLTPQERGALMARAIVMMRETNPNNLNFPYMLEDYTAKLILPENQQYHEPYRAAALPPTDENTYQIAERYLRESLPVYRLHYKEDNAAIYAAECKLAYTLAMLEKWADFDEHYGKCREAREKYEGKSETLYEFLGLVEKTLAEKRRQQ